MEPGVLQAVLSLGLGCRVHGPRDFFMQILMRKGSTSRAKKDSELNSEPCRASYENCFSPFVSNGMKAVKLGLGLC